MRALLIVTLLVAACHSAPSEPVAVDASAPHRSVGATTLKAAEQPIPCDRARQVCFARFVGAGDAGIPLYKFSRKGTERWINGGWR